MINGACYIRIHDAHTLSLHTFIFHLQHCFLEGKTMSSNQRNVLNEKSMESVYKCILYEKCIVNLLHVAKTPLYI